MNLYWPVYQNLEKELIKLSNQIHIDDVQLNVYSVKISELLIRCSVEIESISKDLFLKHGGQLPSEGDLYFDTNCLDYLEKLWLLSKKQIIVSAPNFYFNDEQNQTLTPLNKANKRGTSGSDWKKAYQAVKHNRTHDLRKGNLKNLIRALAALFLLNIYFKSEMFDLKKDSTASEFDTRLGSEIFSIKLHMHSSISINKKYTKKDDFDQCIYFTNVTEESSQIMADAMKNMQEKVNALTNNHLIKTIENALSEGIKLPAENAQKTIEKIISSEKKKIGSEFIIQASRSELQCIKNMDYEALINCNNI